MKIYATQGCAVNSQNKTQSPAFGIGMSTALRLLIVKKSEDLAKSRPYKNSNFELNDIFIKLNEIKKIKSRRTLELDSQEKNIICNNTAIASIEKLFEELESGRLATKIKQAISKKHKTKSARPAVMQAHAQRTQLNENLAIANKISILLFGE